MVEDDIEAMIAQLDQGNREEAIRMNEDFWQKGYELSTEAEINYIDCLLDMGELESAEQMLQAKIQDLSIYGMDYYEVIIKYSFLSGNLNLLNDLSEYEEIYENEPQLFDWIRERYQNYSLRDYGFMLKSIFKQVRGVLCMVEIGVTETGEVAVLYYTNLSYEDNSAMINTVNENIGKFFAEREKEVPTDIVMDLELITGSQN